MSYIIINGKNSNMVNGLLIQSLPPITKPLMRVQVEEIDGRDGDILTYLGYAAYDKTVVIGLHGEFDINEVIRFFDSEGVVTFSSEPDKYYRFQQVGQIDFDRLIRFRQAAVLLHCQPYKYSTTEDTLAITSFTNNSCTVTNSGNTESKPKVTIHGSGTVNLSLNGYLVFTIDLTNNAYLTLDADKMEAYQDSPDTLANRLVAGDYSNLAFQSGLNTLSWTGTVTQIDVENYSRWI